MSQSSAREQILQAAGPVFAESGFHGATIRHICEAAKVNVAAIHYHFGDKSQLYVATVTLAHRLRAQAVPMPEFRESEHPREQLRLFIRTILQRMIGEDGPSWPTQLMLRETMQPTEACRALVRDYFRPLTDRLVAIIGQLAPEEPHHRRQQLAFSVIGQCLYYRVSARVLPMLVGTDALAAHFSVPALAEHIYRFSEAALRPAGADPAVWTTALLDDKSAL